MYSFVHYFIYNQQLQKGKTEGFARSNGSLVAALTIVIHLELIFVIVRKTLSKNYFVSFSTVGYRLFQLLILGIFALAYYWFNSTERTQRIMGKLVTEKDPARGVNAIKVIALIFVPVITMIILVPKAR
jgi:hypothetical protein